MKKRPPGAVTVEASAKVNVGWRVGAKRDDGYHDVQGLLQTISLHDTLRMSAVDSSDLITISAPGHPALEGDDNLIARAARLLAEQGDPRPTSVVLDKRIPVAAGLAGGSADAAAALMGLNTLWGAGLSASDLVRLAALIGSDVPAMLLGGLVHASGRGEVVRRIGSYTDGLVVLGIGSEEVSASATYAAFDRVGAGSDDGLLWRNDLEAAACSLTPGLSDRVSAMREAAGVAFVSGSGPTVVGVVSDKATARAVATKVAGAFARVEIAAPVGHGVRLLLD